MDFLSTLFYVFSFVLIICTIFGTVVITGQNKLKHISLLGKYWFSAKAGISFKIPFISTVDYVVSTAVQEMKIPLRLKTKDQVTFEISIFVFYRISHDPQEAYKASYELEDYKRQMVSIATDSAIPIANNLMLEEIFNGKDKITNEAKKLLVDYFKDYGIDVQKVLSHEPSLPEGVEDAANAVIEAQRKNDAAKYNAEAIKTEKVGEATADGESIKIRMEEIGKARLEYAKQTALAITVLKNTGADPISSMNFLERVGDQDALVASSRNANSIVLSAGSGKDNGSSEIAALVSSLQASLGEIKNKSNIVEKEID